MEPEKEVPPEPGFLKEVQRLCRAHGAVFILDGMICGFRWSLGGGQAFHGVTADLSAFGKALGNGFSVSALVGKREIMELGGYQHDRDRVFCLSLTHGAELPCLAAAKKVLQIYKEEPVIEGLWKRGTQLIAGVQEKVADLGIGDYFGLIGVPAISCTSLGMNRDAFTSFRTLFLQRR